MTARQGIFLRWLPVIVMAVLVPSMYVHAPTWLFVGYLLVLAAMVGLGLWPAWLRRRAARR